MTRNERWFIKGCVAMGTKGRKNVKKPKKAVEKTEQKAAPAKK
jgi:hypothetical protein